MSIFFPLIYSTVVLIILILVNFYIFKQIFKFNKIKIKVKEIDTTISVQTLNISILYDIAKLYAYNNNHLKSIELYQNILEKNNILDKRCQSYLYNLIGSAFLKANKYQEAIMAIKKALILSPFNTVAVINLQKLYKQLGKMDKENNLNQLRKLITME